MTLGLLGVCPNTTIHLESHPNFNIGELCKTENFLSSKLCLVFIKYAKKIPTLNKFSCDFEVIYKILLLFLFS